MLGGRYTLATAAIRGPAEIQTKEVSELDSGKPLPKVRTNARSVLRSPPLLRNNVVEGGDGWEVRQRFSYSFPGFRR